MMKELKASDLVEIDGKVGMTEETAAYLLDVTAEEVHAATEELGLTKAKHGVHERDGQYIYTDTETLFKLRPQVKSTADLSRQKLASAMITAKERLFPEQAAKENKKWGFGCGTVILLLLVGSCFGGSSDKPRQEPPPVKQETQVQKPAPQPKVVESRWTGIPEKINGLASIGSTRAAFDKDYGKSTGEAGGVVSYKNGELKVMFADEDGQQIASPTARAAALIWTNTTNTPFTKEEFANMFEQWLPLDHGLSTQDAPQQVGEKVKSTAYSTSATIGKIFPLTEGKYSVIMQASARTGLCESMIVRIGQ
ncbi:MAG: hypothetical protein K6G55_08680 [Selenomonadaceae bacterium]|nr:hypothetical protein [Selenomonadaceae bacterium]